MQQGRFRATGMMLHHPYAPLTSSVAILITDLVGHFWRADPGHFSKALKETMPEADSCLLDRIRSDAAAPDLSRGLPRIELENRMALAARFASPAIYDPLFNIYTASGKTWPLQAQGYALAYLSRWQPERARPLLDAALPATASQMEPNISFALFQANMGDSLIPFLRDRVLHSPPGQAEGAAYHQKPVEVSQNRLSGNLEEVTFLRLPGVKAITGLSKTSLYALIRERSFPAPIRLGARTVAWVRSEVREWATERVRASR
jgi:predicted DNA-binding transcriptional regulator AlpA